MKSVRSIIFQTHSWPLPFFKSYEALKCHNIFQPFCVILNYYLVFIFLNYYKVVIFRVKVILPGSELLTTLQNITLHLSYFLWTCHGALLLYRIKQVIKRNEFLFRNINE